MNNDYTLFFWLDVVANLCQLESYRMNIEEISNEQLMEELQKQDKVLTEQITTYLRKIEKQNQEIIELLKQKNIDK